jgi:hypothetical protein
MPKPSRIQNTNRGQTRAISPEVVSTGLSIEYDEVYNRGVGKGDPTLCSKQIGAALVEQLVGLVARFSGRFAARTPA